MFDFDVRAGNDHHDNQQNAAAGLWALEGDGMAAGITVIPRRPAVAVSPGCRLREAFRLMSGRNAGAALVASHGVLLGMLHERDVVRRLLDGDENAGDLPVWRVMAAQPDTLVESDSVAYALRKLWAREGRAMAIVGPSGTPLGVLETQDVVAWMCGRVGAPPPENSVQNAT